MNRNRTRSKPAGRMKKSKALLIREPWSSSGVRNGHALFRREVREFLGQGGVVDGPDGRGELVPLELVLEGLDVGRHVLGLFPVGGVVHLDRKMAIALEGNLGNIGRVVLIVDQFEKLAPVHVGRTLNEDHKNKQIMKASKTSQIHEPGMGGVGRRRCLPVGGGDERGGMKLPQQGCLGLCSSMADLTKVSDLIYDTNSGQP